MYFFFFHILFSTDLCHVARGGCSHQCTVAPGKGVVCFCPPGLHLDSSNKTCEVVDYCTRHLKCSQVCEQYKTTVKCSCYPGWTLDADGDTCHSTGNRVRILKFESWNWLSCWCLAVSLSLIVAGHKPIKTLTCCPRALFFYSWCTVCPQSFSFVVANVRLSGSIKPYLQTSGWCFQLFTVCSTVCFGLEQVWIDNFFGGSWKSLNRLWGLMNPSVVT